MISSDKSFENTATLHYYETLDKKVKKMETQVVISSLFLLKSTAEEKREYWKYVKWTELLLDIPGWTVMPVIVHCWLSVKLKESSDPTKVSTLGLLLFSKQTQWQLKNIITSSPHLATTIRSLNWKQNSLKWKTERERIQIKFSHMGMLASILLPCCYQVHEIGL